MVLGGENNYLAKLFVILLILLSIETLRSKTKKKYWPKASNAGDGQSGLPAVRNTAVRNDFGVQIPFGMDRGVEFPRAGAYSMKRKTLLVISLTIALIGLIALFFLKPDVSPQSLQLSGTIKYINQKEKVAFISFVPDNLTVVSFNELDLVPGYYLLTGHLQQYKGKIEFVVDSEELKVRENVGKYKIHNKRNQSQKDEFLEE